MNNVGQLSNTKPAETRHCLEMTTISVSAVLESQFFYFRVFLALSENPRDRGTIVAEGGGKVNGQR